MRWLAKQVEDGLGLMMLGGAHSFGAGGYGRVPEMAAVLPVQMADYELRSPDAEFDPRQHVMQEVKRWPDGDHFLTRLGGNNQDLWTELPPLVGANRLNPTAAGRVLLWGTRSIGTWRDHESNCHPHSGRIRSGTRIGLGRRFHVSLVSPRIPVGTFSFLATSRCSGWLTRTRRVITRSGLILRSDDCLVFPPRPFAPVSAVRRARPSPMPTVGDIERSK